MAERDWGAFPLSAYRVLGLAQGSLGAVPALGCEARRHQVNCEEGGILLVNSIIVSL